MTGDIFQFETPKPVDYGFRRQDHLVAKFWVDGYDRDGRVVSHGESGENDLLLNNFGQFLSRILFTALSAGQAPISSITARSGAAFTLIVYQTISSVLSIGSAAFNIFNSTTFGTLIGVGTSSTAPARGDTDLGALLSVAFVNSQNYSTASSQVTVAGAIVVSNAATVNEAGIYFQGAQATLAAATAFLIAHDLVTPGVAVPSMGSASVNWALQI